MSRSTRSSAATALTTPAAQPESRAATRSGVVFDASADVWRWTDGVFPVSLRFDAVPSGIAHLKDELKQALALVARSSSANHLCALFSSFVHFGHARGPERAGLPIQPVDLANYAAHLGPDLAWRQSTVKLLLVKWVALGLPGVDPECANYYEDRRIPGNRKGDAVRTHDPFHGPFTDLEYLGLYKAVNNAFSQGELPLWAMVLARLLFALGARVSQYASLKLQDLTLKDGKHLLNLPQVKKREEHSRSEFRTCELTPQTAYLVQELIDTELAGGATKESPLFGRATVHGPRVQHPELRDPEFEDHCTASRLGQRFATLVQPFAPSSGRVGYRAIPVNTRRFRYTFGTRLAEEGASIYVIAECLGHADTQSARCYVENSPKLVQGLNKALTPALVPIAQAFRGALVENEAGASQKGAPGTRIIDMRISTTGVGSCGGQTSGCGQLKPVACYTCFKFEPWLDAPHEKLLERLLADRKRFEDDPRMAAVNDDAIVAVREVIAQCEEARELRKGTLT